MVVSGSLKDGVPETNTFVTSQAESLRASGWEVILGVVDDRTSFRGIARNIRRLREEIARTQARLVHAQYGSVTAAVARRIQGSLPLVISFCGDDLLGTPKPGALWRMREKAAHWISLWAARGASAIVVKSSNLQAALPASLRGKETILPNGVNIDWFKPLDRAECRAKLSWSQEARIVLFNASHSEDAYRKNPVLARATMDIVSGVVPDVVMHTISKASSQEVRLAMNAADCLLVTSLHEGSPNIVKEAMACNLPVVSVPCGDVTERLRLTFPGCVRPYDAGSLAEAVTDVLTSAQRSNGREQLIAQGLTTSRVAERLTEIYHRVTNESLSAPLDS